MPLDPSPRIQRERIVHESSSFPLKKPTTKLALRRKKNSRRPDLELDLASTSNLRSRSFQECEPAVFTPPSLPCFFKDLNGDQKTSSPRNLHRASLRPTTIPAAPRSSRNWTTSNATCTSAATSVEAGGSDRYNSSRRTSIQQFASSIGSETGWPTSGQSFTSSDRAFLSPPPTLATPSSCTSSCASSHISPSSSPGQNLGEEGFEFTRCDHPFGSGHRSRSLNAKSWAYCGSQVKEEVDSDSYSYRLRQRSEFPTVTSHSSSTLASQISHLELQAPFLGLPSPPTTSSLTPSPPFPKSTYSFLHPALQDCDMILSPDFKLGEPLSYLFPLPYPNSPHGNQVSASGEQRKMLPGRGHNKLNHLADGVDSVWTPSSSSKTPPFPAKRDDLHDFTVHRGTVIMLKSHCRSGETLTRIADGDSNHSKPRVNKLRKSRSSFGMGLGKLIGGRSGDAFDDPQEDTLSVAEKVKGKVRLAGQGGSSYKRRELVLSVLDASKDVEMSKARTCMMVGGEGRGSQDSRMSLPFWSRQGSDNESLAPSFVSTSASSCQSSTATSSACTNEGQSSPYASHLTKRWRSSIVHPYASLSPGKHVKVDTRAVKSEWQAPIEWETSLSTPRTPDDASLRTARTATSPGSEFSRQQISNFPSMSSTMGCPPSSDCRTIRTKAVGAECGPKAFISIFKHPEDPCRISERSRKHQNHEENREKERLELTSRSFAAVGEVAPSAHKNGVIPEDLPILGPAGEAREGTERNWWVLKVTGVMTKAEEDGRNTKKGNKLVEWSFEVENLEKLMGWLTCIKAQIAHIQAYEEEFRNGTKTKSRSRGLATGFGVSRLSVDETPSSSNSSLCRGSQGLQRSKSYHTCPVSSSKTPFSVPVEERAGSTEPFIFHSSPDSGPQARDSDFHASPTESGFTVRSGHMRQTSACSDGSISSSTQGAHRLKSQREVRSKAKFSAMLGISNHTLEMEIEKSKVLSQAQRNDGFDESDIFKTGKVLTRSPSGRIRPRVKEFNYFGGEGQDDDVPNRPVFQVRQAKVACETAWQLSAHLSRKLEAASGDRSTSFNNPLPTPPYSGQENCSCPPHKLPSETPTGISQGNSSDTSQILESMADDDGYGVHPACGPRPLVEGGKECSRLSTRLPNMSIEQEEAMSSDNIEELRNLTPSPTDPFLLQEGDEGLHDSGTKAAVATSPICLPGSRPSLADATPIKEMAGLAVGCSQKSEESKADSDDENLFDVEFLGSEVPMPPFRGAGFRPTSIKDSPGNARLPCCMEDTWERDGEDFDPFHYEHEFGEHTYQGSGSDGGGIVIDIEVADEILINGSPLIVHGYGSDDEGTEGPLGKRARGSRQGRRSLNRCACSERQSRRIERPPKVLSMSSSSDLPSVLEMKGEVSRARKRSTSVSCLPSSKSKEQLPDRPSTSEGNLGNDRKRGLKARDTSLPPSFPPPVCPLPPLPAYAMGIKGTSITTYQIRGHVQGASPPGSHSDSIRQENESPGKRAELQGWTGRPRPYPWHSSKQNPLASDSSSKSSSAKEDQTQSSSLDKTKRLGSSVASTPGSPIRPLRIESMPLNQTRKTLPFELGGGSSSSASSSFVKQQKDLQQAGHVRKQGSLSYIHSQAFVPSSHLSSSASGLNSVRRWKQI
ncbi:hypothetical protein IE53DRAFT_367144 [Violaceomyces palustris]|uniref:Uncharacterized protein n=1 Tax=Violaceomyces palustris TaxID=1673888 RepID=A0ACD0P391_9BASI|nr:hypothetical protein IE53DRAFT_367144 [Violaceomyces palustris]